MNALDPLYRLNLHLEKEDKAAAITYCQNKGWLQPGQYLDSLPVERLRTILDSPGRFLRDIFPFRPDNLEGVL